MYKLQRSSYLVMLRALAVTVTACTWISRHDTITVRSNECDQTTGAHNGYSCRPMWGQTLTELASDAHVYNTSELAVIDMLEGMHVLKVNDWYVRRVMCSCDFQHYNECVSGITVQVVANRMCIRTTTSTHMNVRTAYVRSLIVSKLYRSIIRAALYERRNIDR
jgi:hypothetical protein